MLPIISGINVVPYKAKSQITQSIIAKIDRTRINNYSICDEKTGVSYFDYGDQNFNYTAPSGKTIGKRFHPEFNQKQKKINQDYQIELTYSSPFAHKLYAC